ncbi:uncharacterized protein LY79DRAFT_25222 [Colletotrichum navitas]|uniref:Uncharacterized protein n=1 Tax=Colletotrichum navitas TaxID=681940 RepID=A0AAD8QDE6_9PEZI|nr:uncharacterized protein LY79DRAFT_25222 [Colletotrichum navitas]KAK1600601.1 hypothetical protein LY79DRAFT_25222 [Colletotrichum navitas]
MMYLYVRHTTLFVDGVRSWVRSGLGDSGWTSILCLARKTLLNSRLVLASARCASPQTPCDSERRRYRVIFATKKKKTILPLGLVTWLFLCISCCRNRQHAMIGRVYNRHGPMRNAARRTSAFSRFAEPDETTAVGHGPCLGETGRVKGLPILSVRCHFP